MLMSTKIINTVASMMTMMTTTMTIKDATDVCLKKTGHETVLKRIEQSA